METVRECSTCGAPFVETDRFCTKCGTSRDGVARGFGPSALPDPLAIAAVNKLASARKWLLAVSIITLLSGFLFHFLNKQEVESDIRKAEMQLSHLSDAQRDEAAQHELGMTWEEAKAHDRGMVNMLLAVNIGLAIAYFAMWIWARKNPYAASITALLLFITTILVSAVLEPTTLVQGVIVKVFFIIALSRAISAGAAARRAGLAHA